MVKIGLIVFVLKWGENDAATWQKLDDFRLFGILVF